MPALLPEQRPAPTDQLRLLQVGHETVHVHLVRRVGHAQTLGLLEQLLALGAIGQHGELVVDGVEGRQLEARQVALPRLRAVQALQRLLAVGGRGQRAHAPHLQLAGARRLQVLGPLGGGKFQPDADRPHVLLPQLVELAALLVGLGGVLDEQRRTIGLLAPAIAIAVDIAVQIEQRLGARRVEITVGALEGRVVAGRVRHHDALRGYGHAAAHEADFAVDVHAQADGAAQCHALGLQAADDRVFHVEVAQRRAGLQHALATDALARQVGRHLAAGHGDGHEVERHFDEVDLAVEEGQPARLRFFDHRDLDAVDERDAPALQPRRDGLAFDIIGSRLGIPQHLAVGRVAFEHDRRRAPPGAQTERPRAHRVLHDLVAIVLHHLARHGAVEVRRGQRLGEARPWQLDAELHRVAVRRAQALDLALVVEGLLAVERLLAQLGQADEAQVGDAGPAGRLERRVGKALEGEDVVSRRQLARLALEGRVVLKVDAAFDAHSEGAEIGRDLGHGLGRQRPDLHRPRQVVVAVQGLEDVRRDGARVQVGQLRRVEAGLGDREGDPQHLQGLRPLSRQHLQRLRPLSRQHLLRAGRRRLRGQGQGRQGQRRPGSGAQRQCVSSLHGAPAPRRFSSSVSMST